ncbi:MAG: hypothetical protein LBN96_08230 [Desulfovibrio sp.]|nr:hypothetical protein [Desulfovibrio sp.]
MEITPFGAQASPVQYISTQSEALTALRAVAIAATNSSSVRGFIPRSRKWYQKAADQGNADGQSRLAVMLWNGKGIIRNRQEACRLWRTAGEQGDKDAIDNYNRLCSD